ncbi:hypothetical protein HPB52_015946 [Rhipicephalus sanguineus]|uniref:Uncharacterized protein n=1 Tax=Rhipicephalus sanguineus TaxID=34632 RepID=A0A9D4PNN1_RHISA|nr:hypothetical protein HPB52_015946 [Rhipicephalus sanguineus]
MLANQAEHGDHAGIATAAATMAHAKQAVVNCVLVPLQQIAKDSLDKMDENVVFPDGTTISATTLRDRTIVCRGVVDGMLANPAAVTRQQSDHMRAIFEEIFPHLINVFPPSAGQLQYRQRRCQRVFEKCDVVRMLANQAEHGDHAGIAAAAATMAHAKQAVVNCVLVPLQQ